MKNGWKKTDMYQLEFEPAAYRVYKKFPPAVKKAIADKALIIKEDPLHGQPLTGKHRGLRSLHFSLQGVAYRIVYQAVAETETIIIRLAGTRENIYRKLEEMAG